MHELGCEKLSVYTVSACVLSWDAFNSLDSPKVSC